MLDGTNMAVCCVFCLAKIYSPSNSSLVFKLPLKEGLCKKSYNSLWYGVSECCCVIQSYKITPCRALWTIWSLNLGIEALIWRKIVRNFRIRDLWKMFQSSDVVLQAWIVFMNLSVSCLYVRDEPTIQCIKINFPMSRYQIMRSSVRFTGKGRERKWSTTP